MKSATANPATDETLLASSILANADRLRMLHGSEYSTGDFLDSLLSELVAKSEQDRRSIVCLSETEVAIITNMLLREAGQNTVPGRQGQRPFSLDELVQWEVIDGHESSHLAWIATVGAFEEAQRNLAHLPDLDTVKA